MTNVFISWSGSKSKKIAEELRKWIPSVIQFAKPYFTPSDIDKGAKWASEISKKLSDSNVGIICLTKENLERPWILFEAGALSKDLDESKVCSVLFGMDNADLSGPLTTFQATSFEKSDFKKMMQSINDTGGDHALAKDTFDGVFDKWWPDLETAINKILADDDADHTEIRSDRELLEEILLLSRSRTRAPHVSETTNVPSALVSDLLKWLDQIAISNARIVDGDIHEAIARLLRIAGYLSNHSDDPSENRELIRILTKKNDDLIPF